MNSEVRRKKSPVQVIPPSDWKNHEIDDNYSKDMRDRRLSLQFTWILSFSGMLRSVGSLRSDVSVLNQPTLPYIPEDNNVARAACLYTQILLDHDTAPSSVRMARNGGSKRAPIGNEVTWVIISTLRYRRESELLFRFGKWVVLSRICVQWWSLCARHICPNMFRREVKLNQYGPVLPI